MFMSAEVSTSQPDLKKSYAYCRAITKSRAQNFYYAFLTLPPHQRRSIYASYAFCRLCDDYSDEGGSVAEKAARLTEFRNKFDAAMATKPNDELFTALRDTIDVHHIPQHYFHEIIDGMEMDLKYSRYATFDELERYCYHVASVVGLVCLEIFTYTDQKAKDYAISLGTAMQLTNILRDIPEDAGRGRIYIPQEDLRKFDYSEQDLLAGALNKPFADMMSFEVQRARAYFDRSRPLDSLVPPRPAACISVLRGLYERILKRIEAERYNVFSKRISLPTPQKLILTGSLWAKSVLPRR